MTESLRVKPIKTMNCYFGFEEMKLIQSHVKDAMLKHLKKLEMGITG